MTVPRPARPVVGLARAVDMLTRTTVRLFPQLRATRSLAPAVVARDVAKAILISLTAPK
jgi:hypothetical protein